MTKPKQHKYHNIVQVGDKVKYKNGEAHYIVKYIGGDRNNGILCDIVRDNEYSKEYNGILLNKLDVVAKNVNLLSHEQIEMKTDSNSHKEKTNPHRKVGMVKTAVKHLDYLITEYDDILGEEEIHSHEIRTGKYELAKYLLELDSKRSTHRVEIRVLGRVVKSEIKREVILKWNIHTNI